MGKISESDSESEESEEGEDRGVIVDFVPEMRRGGMVAAFDQCATRAFLKSGMSLVEMACQNKE